MRRAANGLALLMLVGWAVWWVANLKQARMLWPLGLELWVPRFDYLQVDFHGIYVVARYWRNGGDPYDAWFLDPLRRPFVFAPIVLPLFAWCKWVGTFAVARAIWTVSLAGMIAAGAVYAARVRGQLHVTELPTLLIVALVLWCTPALFAMERGNFDAMVLVLFAGAAWCFETPRRAREVGGAAMIALASWLKLYPAAALLPLAVMGRRRVVVWAVAVAGAIALLDVRNLGPFFWRLQRLVPQSASVTNRALDRGEHSFSGAWNLWTSGTALEFAPGVLVAAVLVLPGIVWLGRRVMRSATRQALLYPYLLWVTSAATFVPLTSNDYNLIFLPVASLAMWTAKDPMLVHLGTAATILWYQPFSLGFAPVVLLALKILSVVTVGGILAIRSAERTTAAPRSTALPEAT